MTNRQMIMLKLIQLSDEEFAEFMDNEITYASAHLCHNAVRCGR